MTTTSLMLKGCGKNFQYKDNHCMIVWGTRPHGRFSGFTILVSMATGCPCSRCRRTNSVKDKMSSNQSALVCVHLEQSYRVLWPLCALLRSSRWQSYSGQSIAPLVQSLKVVRLMLQKQQQRFCLSLVLTEATIILQQRCCSQGMLALYLRTVKVGSTTLDGPLWRLGSSFDFILSLGTCYGYLWVWGVMVSMCLCTNRSWLERSSLVRVSSGSPPLEIGSSVPKDAGGKMHKLQSNSDTYNNWLEPCWISLLSFRNHNLTRVRKIWMSGVLHKFSHTSGNKGGLQWDHQNPWLQSGFQTSLYLEHFWSQSDRTFKIQRV